MYSNDYHKIVASIDLGIYTWRAHSTGWLLKELRARHPDGYKYWFNYHESEYWFEQYKLRIRDELSKRPYLNTKGRRKQLTSSKK